MKIIVFDTETTGLPKNRKASPEHSHLWPYIVQISWLVFDDSTNKITNINDHIIKLPEGMDVPESSSRIHGITTEKMRSEGKNIKDILDIFTKDYLSCQIVVAHNINFDLDVIQAELHRNNFTNWLKLTNNIKYCTMKYGKTITNIMVPSKFNNGMYQKPPKLIELHSHLFHTEPSNLHNSMTDVWVCFRCFYQMLYMEDIVKKYSDLGKYYNEVCCL